MEYFYTGSGVGKGNHGIKLLDYIKKVRNEKWRRADEI